MKPITTSRLIAASLLSLLAPWCLSGCTHMAFGTRTAVDVQGPVQVDIVTFAGDVTVTSTGDSTGSPHVLVKPLALHGIHRMGDAKASLADIDWSIATTQEGGRTVLRVRATTKYPNSGLQRLHITVAVPDVDGLIVKTTLGDVDVVDVAGPIDINTTRGFVSIVTHRPLHGPISVMTTEGGITLRAPPGTSGRLDAFTADGVVTTNIRQGRFIVSGRVGDQSMQGVINNGTEPIVLRTNDGKIRVVVKDNPTQQASFIFD
jgi:hypothetical protein